MTIEYEIYADSLDRAARIARSRAHSDGWRTVMVFRSQWMGNQSYRVQLQVANHV